MKRAIISLGALSLFFSPALVFSLDANISTDADIGVLPLSGPAYTLADDAYRAYARGDYRRALREAMEASRLRPDVARLRDLIDKSRRALNPSMPVLEKHAVISKPKSKRSAPSELVHKDPSYSEAESAYAATRRHDLDSALMHATSAVKKSPTNLQYRLLLIDALIQMGQLEQASGALDDSVAALGTDAALSLRRSQIQQQRAALPASSMYRALASGDLVNAITAARQAVALAPTKISFRLVLTQALLQKGDDTNAIESADELLALNPGEPDTAIALVLRGFARQRSGLQKAAEQDFDLALQQRSSSDPVQRTSRLIAADAALAAREPQRALDILAILGEASDTDVQSRRRAGSAQLQRSASALQAAAPAMSVPSIDCASGSEPQHCQLIPTAPPAAPGYAIAASAYKSFNEGRFDDAIAQIREALLVAPDNRMYQLLLANAALSAQRFDVAEQAATAALESMPEDAPLLAQRGYLRQRLGNTAGAQMDFTQALRLGGLPLALEIGLLSDTGQKQAAWHKYIEALNNNAFSHLSPLELAYLAARSGDDATAVRAFALADRDGALPVTSLQDAAYASVRSGRDGSAIGYFKRAIDAVATLQLRMEPQLLFDTRRAVATVSREGGVIASLSHRGVASATGPTIGSGAREGNALQAGVEAYWRPFGYQGGRTVEVFGRAFETLRDGNGGGTGAATLQGAVGARWKPLTDYNLVGSIVRLVPLGSQARGDWLAQLAYSGGVGTDLRVDVPSWWTSQWFAEAGHYFEHPQTYGIGSAQFGRSYRLGGIDPNLIMFPHITINADYNSLDSVARAIGAGAGVNFRYWYREDKYNAPRSFIDLSLQYRMRLDGDARARGLFMTTTLSY